MPEVKQKPPRIRIAFERLTKDCDYVYINGDLIGTIDYRHKNDEMFFVSTYFDKNFNHIPVAKILNINL